MARARVQLEESSRACESCSGIENCRATEGRGGRVSCCWSWPLRRQTATLVSSGHRPQRPEGNNMLHGSMESLQYLAIYLFLRLHMLASVSEIAFSSKQFNYLQLPSRCRCQCLRYLFLLFRISFGRVFITCNFHNHSQLLE